MLIKVNNSSPYENKDIAKAKQWQANEAIYQKLINQGMKPERYVMNDSVEKELPYICFIETEYDLVTKGTGGAGLSPLKGWIPDILYLIQFYSREFTDLDKAVHQMYGI